LVIIKKLHKILCFKTIGCIEKKNDYSYKILKIKNFQLNSLTIAGLLEPQKKKCKRFGQGKEEGSTENSGC
jgi:hypothetical protein